ncbi:MAG: hypothetical protein HRT38_04485 [Alteromonadaceae bacterium]|nr:hypothetical protein [Alteromonadaceae bacterium]
MLNFSQISFIPTVILLTLSFSALANNPQYEKTGLSTKSPPNLVELFKVKEHASGYIKELEKKIRSNNTNDEEQEYLFVELAQSLLYYQERHKPESKTNSIHSKNSSTKGFNSNSLKSENRILNKVLNAYKKASALALSKNRIKYTRKLSELAVKLQKKDVLVQIFDELLQHGGDETGTYLAHVDYADGLAKFKDNSAETQFLSAINMRSPTDGVEANFRYASYLLDNNKHHEALSVLDKFTFEERSMYIHIALLRQKTMHLLKLDTQKVDTEMKQIRKKMSNTPFINAIPKLFKSVTHLSTNKLALTEAYAFNDSPNYERYSHNNESDDSRGKYGDKWVTIPQGFIISPYLINAAEVVYNEARGASAIGRYAIAWAIRNRATIDMNDCDSYPGSESDHEVSACRVATPDGPESSFTDTFKRYSCVVHGGTTKVGGSHSQMNDTHVNKTSLASSGVIWEMLNVVNGWILDPTSPNFFTTDKRYPNFDVSKGNPEGAQEWKNSNYCAKNHSCKVRLGNVGGNFPDTPTLCSIEMGLRNNLYDFNSKDNFFWGRSDH